MNPLTRRRAERRRLADWAARAHRVPQDNADATLEGDYGAGNANPAPVRRLPFELLDPPAAVALALPSPDGNGHGTPEAMASNGNRHGAPEAAVEQVDPPAAVAPADAAPKGNGNGAHGPVEPAGPPAAIGAPAPEAAEPEPAEPEPALVDETASSLQAASRALEGHDLALAEQVYREVLADRPESIAARNGLALVLDARGEHGAALEQLDRCRAQDQSNVEVLVNRCGVLGSLGRFTDAERGLRAALEQEPGNAAAQFHLGLVISRRGRWRDAVPYFRQATALDPNQSAAHFYLGEALNHMDDLPGALQAYQRAVELSPRNPKAWYGMGIVLDRMNRPDDAAQQYRRSRQLQGK